MTRRSGGVAAVVLALAGAWFVGQSVSPAAQAQAPDREGAYRANNVGVAFMEQYLFEPAVERFRKAVALDPQFATARINLGIALYYLPDLPEARKELEAAAGMAPEALSPPYLLGLIARQENRLDDAAASLRKVLAKDARDVGANVTLGQVLLAQRNYAEALPLLEAAVAAEPYNVTGLYNLGVALTRSGRREEGAKITAKFQELREGPYKTQMGNAYLEQGKYAETQATTGAEAELVDAATPTVAFTDKTASFLPPGPVRGGSRAIADIDGDGRLDLVSVGPDGVRVLRNEGARLVDATKAWAVPAGAGTGVLAGDYDSDGKPDLVVFAGAATPRVLRNEGKRFVDGTAEAKVESLPFAPASAAFVDLDHDGDLDLFLAGSPAASASARRRLLRNNGDGTFADITATARLDAGEGRAIAVAPTDFDERRDVDLLVVNEDRAPLLFKNLRDGTFQDAAADVGLPASGFRCAAVGDINKDGFSDFFFGSAAGPGVFALSDGRARFSTKAAPAATEGARAAALFDYDRDGLLDLVVALPSGLRLVRNVGGDFRDVTDVALAGVKGPLADDQLLVGDLDGDGAQDLIVSGPVGAPRVLNNGASKNASFPVRLTGRVSNRNGVGAKVDLRAGALRQRIETSATMPPVAPTDVVFGLGKRAAPDAVRILWPSGIVQTETEFPGAGAGPRTALAVTELDRKPSSCPYLYAWNGERFEFVTDFLGGGEMGYWLAPGVRNVPDPTEYVRIRGDQLRERDGRLELRVTNELEEVLYLDEVKLLAVSHPEGVEVYPNEGMTEPPREHKVWAVRDLVAPAAIDHDGKDVRDEIARLDRRYPEGFRLGPLRGYAEEHSLTLDLGGLPAEKTLLVLTAWTDYAFSSDNVAASQRGLVMKPPALQVRDGDGRWQTVNEDIGIPVGRPQTMVLDTKGLWRSADRGLRIVTNMRIYWDQIRVGAPAEVPLATETLDPRVASLRERGFSREVSPDGREPFTYEYANVSWAQPWKTAPGRYTRLGDVTTLLDRTDDLFVVSKPGDDVALSFDAASLRPLAKGSARTFLLYGVGYSKEMDINSSSPDVVQPIPFHGMPAYPFAAEAVPAAVRERQAAKALAFDTRLVGRSLPPVELAQETDPRGAPTP